MSYNPSPEMLNERQRSFLDTVARLVAGMGEPLRSAFTPAGIAQLVADSGLTTAEAPTERDLANRYFTGRPDGLTPMIIERLLWLRV